jgi:hypothetical protein
MRHVFSEPYLGTWTGITYPCPKIAQYRARRNVILTDVTGLLHIYFFVLKQLSKTRRTSKRM